MAPNAIPLLLKWVQVKDSPLKLKMILWMDQHPAIPSLFKPAEEYHLMAVAGFELLETDAEPAWPVLIQLTCTSGVECRSTALACLAETMPDRGTMLLVLLRLIHDQDKHVQEQSSYILHASYPQDAEASGVYKMFPEFKSRPINRSATNHVH